MSGARHVRANGLRFATLQWGRADGPLALLLHGFPDHAQTWRHLGPALAEDGWRVVAPWLRGYAPTEVPSDRLIGLPTLVADVQALHEALGGGPDAVLVGHDWGAAIAYEAAAGAPQRWQRVVTMATPPEPAWRQALRDPGQWRRSWYMLAFQVPGAERLVARDDFALVDRLWRAWSPGYRQPPEDRAALLATLRSPGTLRAALGYYRAMGRAVVQRRFPRANGTVPGQPTLYLHGRRDRCIGVRTAQAAIGLRPTLQTEIVPGVGHFLHLQDPDGIADRVRTFLLPRPHRP